VPLDTPILAVPATGKKNYGEATARAIAIAPGMSRRLDLTGQVCESESWAQRLRGRVLPSGRRADGRNQGQVVSAARLQ
jgi:hypothetical protein